MPKELELGLCYIFINVILPLDIRGYCLKL